MPTIFTHAAVPLALGLGLGARIIPRRLLVAGVVASMLPDCDVIGFRLHIAYADVLGHRGAFHSILFAVLVGLLAAVFASRLRTSRLTAFLFSGICTASHGLLDTLTNGGLGVALWWPWSPERYFAPWRVIEVAPFGLHIFSSPRGQAVLYSELCWVWLPAILLCASLMLVRHYCLKKNKISIAA